MKYPYTYDEREVIQKFRATPEGRHCAFYPYWSGKTKAFLQSVNYPQDARTWIFDRVALTITLQESDAVKLVKKKKANLNKWDAKITQAKQDIKKFRKDLKTAEEAEATLAATLKAKFNTNTNARSARRTAVELHNLLAAQKELMPLILSKQGLEWVDLMTSIRDLNLQQMRIRNLLKQRHYAIQRMQSDTDRTIETLLKPQ